SRGDHLWATQSGDQGRGGGLQRRRHPPARRRSNSRLARHRRPGRAPVRAAPRRSRISAARSDPLPGQAPVGTGGDMRSMMVGAAALFLAVFALSSPAVAVAPVAMIDLDGAITPVTARLLTAAIERAQAERAQALIVRLNTPGGLERSMRSMAQAILNAEIPVIVYVAPTGARAASAGVFITMAAHVAAMAPATNIGAAHPVTIGGGDTGKEMGKKIENDAAAFARSLAAERGRNVDWAEKAVRASVSVTEREAVKL